MIGAVEFARYKEDHANERDAKDARSAVEGVFEVQNRIESLADHRPEHQTSTYRRLCVAVHLFSLSREL